MKIGLRVVPTFFLLCLAVVPAAEATSLYGNSRTYFSTWESLDEERHFTLYEYLDAGLLEAGHQNLSFHFGGWGRVDFGEESYGDSSNSEFQYGYLNYAHDRANATVRLGRMYVSEGVALHENFDGVYLGSDLTEHLSFSLYSGIPVEVDGDGRSGDFLYGGRIAAGFNGIFELGGSYLKSENDENEHREEFGIDFFLNLWQGLQVDGQSSYNAIREGWADHDYRISLGPFQGLTFVGEGWWVDYEHYFQSPSLGAFIPPLVDPAESLTLLSGHLEYALSPQVTLAGTFENFSYDDAASANAFGARLLWSADGRGAGVIYRRVNGDTDALSYSEYRGYVYAQFGRVDATLDVLDIVYDEKINGVDDAYAIVGALGYNFSENLRFAADLEYASNPLFEEEVKAFLKILYRFSAASSESGEGN